MSRAFAWSVREREEGGEGEEGDDNDETSGSPLPPPSFFPPVRTFHRPASRPYFSVVSSASVFSLSLLLAAARATVRRLLRLLLLLPLLPLLPLFERF